MHAFLVSAAAFIVLVGVMVVVHELGHFTVAKLCRVRVEAFSFGFGPRLFGVTYGETEYKICLLPLGGYVKMTGEASEQNLEGTGTTEAVDLAGDPGALTSHPRWQRMLIGVAGPAFNFLLTLVLMFFYFAAFNEVPSVTVNTTTVDWVIPGSAAADAGIQPGDQIVHFDTANHPDWYDVLAHSQVSANQTVPVSVLRDGKTLDLSFHVPSSAKNEDFDWGDEGLLPQYLPGPIAVDEVQAGYPAAQAGLRNGDAIAAVDGHAFHSVGALLAYMQVGKGKPIVLTVVRNSATLNLVATPAKLDAYWKLGFSGVLPPIRRDPLSLPSAASKSLDFFRDNSLLVGEVLQRLFTHKLSVTQLMGPVGIARAAGEAAEIKSWQPKFMLASEISLQLGILNLLPFPILDGGMIALLLIESAIRRDISIAIKERIYQAAFVVLMAFFAFIIFNDVSKLPLFQHIKP
ncbi:MAG: RIP metalloprotease RseP [Terracidiphilus sp.]